MVEWVVEWVVEWIAGVFFSSFCSSVCLSAEWRRLWSLSSSMQSSGGDGDTRLPGRVMWSSDDQVMEVKTLDLGVEWCDEIEKSSTRPGGRVVSWDLEAPTQPRGRVVWHDQVPFFQVTWNKHKYATCMQTYPKYVKWWQMMRNGIKQWWYDAKVMANGCSKHAYQLPQT